MSHDQLSDNWRRTRCRFAFLLGCVVPTAITVYLILHPPTVNDWEQAILAELGIPTTIDSIETPGPNVTILRGVKFSDAQIGELFTATQIRVIRGKVNRILVDHSSRFSSQSLVRLISFVSEHLVRGDRIQKPWSIEFQDTATVFSEILNGNYTTPLVTRNLRIEVDRYKNGPAATIEFTKDDDQTNNLVSGYISKGTEAPLQLGLQTSGCHLPCWLLADIVPDLKKLGNDCVFTGKIDIHPFDQNPEEIVSTINGAFTNIDLSSFVYPYRQQLHGKCTAVVSEFVIKNGVIHGLEASVHCDKGVVGLDLLASAQRHMGFQLSPNIGQLANEEGNVGFQSMQLNLAIRQGELLLATGDTGVIAYDSYHQSLAKFKSFGTVELPLVRSVEDLANFVVPPGSNAKSVAKATFDVMHRFYQPIPPIVAESPIRMVEENDGSIQR